MIARLAFRNTKKQLKDYSISIFTIAFTCSLVIAFYLLAFSKQIKAISIYAINLQLAVFAISIPIIITIAWLTNYLSRFIFNKRSKEFGIYMLSGVSKNSILKMFIIENLFIQIISYIIALIVGYYFYHILAAIILNVYKLPFNFSFALTWQSVVAILLSFLFISSTNLFFNYLRIRKNSISNYFHKLQQNEKIIKNMSLVKLFLFIVSLFLMISSILYAKHLFTNSVSAGDQKFTEKLFATLGSFLVGIFLFYYSIAHSLVFLLKSKKYSHHKDNLFITRTLTSKIHVLGSTFGFLGILFLLSFSALNTGGTISKVFNHVNKINAPTDLFISSYNNADYSLMINYLHENYNVKEDVIIDYYYLNGNNELEEKIKNSDYYDYRWYIIKLSDYNTLMKFSNRQQIDLAYNEFIISTSTYGLENKIAPKQSYSINQSQYYLKEIEIGGVYYDSKHILVFNDLRVNDLTPNNNTYFANFVSEFNEQDFKYLKKTFDPEDHYYMVSKVDTINSATSWNLLILLGSYYLSLIFFTIAFSTLSIQQLYESMKSKKNYRTLSLLGINKSRINNIILKQLIFYYIFPIILPLILGYIISSVISNLFYYYVPPSSVIASFFLTLLIFFIIYIIYLLITFKIFKKNILSN